MARRPPVDRPPGRRRGGEITKDIKRRTYTPGCCTNRYVFKHSKNSEGDGATAKQGAPLLWCTRAWSQQGRLLTLAALLEASERPRINIYYVPGDYDLKFPHSTATAPPARCCRCSGGAAVDRQALQSRLSLSPRRASVLLPPNYPIQLRIKTAMQVQIDFNNITHSRLLSAHTGC